MLGRGLSFLWEDLDRSFNVPRTTLASVSQPQLGLSLSEARELIRCIANYQSVREIRERVTNSANGSIRLLILTRDFDATDPKDKIFCTSLAFPRVRAPPV